MNAWINNWIDKQNNEWMTQWIKGSLTQRQVALKSIYHWVTGLVENILWLFENSSLPENKQANKSTLLL